MKEYRIDCSAITDAPAFHERLAQVFSLPDWYGHNLDALFDCLTELETPAVLILENWDDSASFAEGFAGVFLDVQSEISDFTVKFL